MLGTRLRPRRCGPYWSASCAASCRCLQRPARPGTWRQPSGASAR